MAETGNGQVSPGNQEKARTFFKHARAKFETSSYDYAIGLYLDGLKWDPNSVEGHKALRETALTRKVTGGKDLGMFDKLKYKRSSKDETENLLNAARLLSYDPGSCDAMVMLLNAAAKLEYGETVLWVGPILAKASAERGKPDVRHFIALKDAYMQVGRWDLALEAIGEAVRMKPDDMDLTQEQKNIGAQHTMMAGNYTKGGGFQDSVRDKDKQQQLMEQDKDIRSSEGMGSVLAAVKAEYEANSNDAGILGKYVDALEKTEESKFEDVAIDLLNKWYVKTQSYRFKQRIGDIEIRRLTRQERAKRAALAKAPSDEHLKLDLREFVRDRNLFELNEYTERAEAYPTETKWKYAVGVRLFDLGRYDESIPVLQQVRNDPRFKVEAGMYLARAFYEAGFLEEADETLDQLISEYDVKGDDKAKAMYYWRGRVLEARTLNDQAIRLYSQVAQWDFAFRDVQVRIKALRAAGKPA